MFFKFVPKLCKFAQSDHTNYVVVPVEEGNEGKSFSRLRGD